MDPHRSPRHPEAARDDHAARYYAEAAVQRVDTGDAILPCRRFGRGPALLFVHGFPLSGFTWRKVLPALAEQFTCYVVDLAGLGDSEWTPSTDFSFEGQARRLRALADTLHLDDYALLAHDTGATVARCLARIDAGRVRGLVMINTEIPGHRPPWIREYQFLMHLPGAEFGFRQLLRSGWYVRSGAGFGGCVTDLTLLDGDFHAAFVAPYVHSGRRTEGMRRYLLGCRWDVVDNMARWHTEMRMPVLLVWGEDDPTFPIARARAMVTDFPDCRGLVAIPGTKLLPHEERPAAVTGCVIPFLNERSPAHLDQSPP